jgi:hypothetical protein
MKHYKTLLLALLTLIAASLAFGQPGSVFIVYQPAEGSEPLGYPCAGPRTAFPDNSIISIFWDADGNGPTDNDVQPPIGGSLDSCNMNAFGFNGEAQGIGAGYFFTLDPATFSMWELPDVPRYYLKVSSPDGGGVCWVSSVYTLMHDYQEWSLTFADFTCASHECVGGGTAPTAPTNFIASDNLHCLEVKAFWTHDHANTSGYRIYDEDSALVYTAGGHEDSARFTVLTDQVKSYFIRAFNTVESENSNMDAGSTFLIRFKNDSTGNIRGWAWHGRQFTVKFDLPPDTLPCASGTALFLLEDTTANQTGGYKVFGGAPLCTDSLDTMMTCTFPDSMLSHGCRLLLVDSSYAFLNVVFTDTTDSTFHLEPIDAVTINTGVRPDQFELAQNYPNPFNPTTEIRFNVPVQADVRINVYNIMGQLVRTLANQTYTAGFHQITWDGTSNAGTQVSAGIYIYRMQAPGFEQSMKMFLMK